MNLSLEMALSQLNKWKDSSVRLSVAVGRENLRVFAKAIISAVASNLLVLTFSEVGDGLTLVLSHTSRFRSFLPSEVVPSEFETINKGCALLLIISFEDGTVCKMCELSDDREFRVVLSQMADADG